MSVPRHPARPTLKSIATYIAKNAAEVKKAQHVHPASPGSVREAEYQGHRIVIRTTYRIEVDGVPVTGHVGVTADGRVHYHAVPNASFASAVDLVKRLIEVFPDDFNRGADGSGPRGGHGPSHKRSAPTQGTPRGSRRGAKKSKSPRS